MSDPAFVIIQTDGKRIEIFEDGKVRGLKGVIINRIPLLLDRAREDERVRARAQSFLRLRQMCSVGVEYVHSWTATKEKRGALARR